MPDDLELVDLADSLIDEQQPQVFERPWMKNKKFVLVTEDNINQVVDECIASGRYALDLETTGLDNRVFPHPNSPGMTRDRIAGVCLSPDGVTGYYAPIRHLKRDPNGTLTPRSCNIPMTVFRPAFQRLMQATMEGKTVANFHGGKFDQEFLEYNGDEPFGCWDNPKHWDDTLLLAYLADPRARRRGLKFLAKEKLGIDMIELPELYPPDHKGGMDFSLLDPTRQETLWYGGGDGICTWLLYPELAPAVLNPDTDGNAMKNLYLVEKGAATATRWMERCRLHIDRDKVFELITLGQIEWHASVMDIYREAADLLGRNVMPGFFRVIQEDFVPGDPTNLLPQQIVRAKSVSKQRFPDPESPVKAKGKEFPPIYDISSAQQLGKMFQEMGVPGLTLTEKSKQVKTDKATLEKVMESAGDTFPFLKRIKKFRETARALTNYLYPMYQNAEPTDDTIRINFKQDGTDTGRYSTPIDKKRKMMGYPNMNLHGIPSTYDPERPECMSRLRECISARPTPPGKPKKVIVAADYSGEELRLITNLSGEPKWRNEFFHCANCDRVFDKGDGKTTPEAPPPRCPNCGSDKIGDLHTLTGISLFGADAPSRKDWKKVRGMAKGTNFALSYGGGGNAVCRSTGVDKQEGGRIKRQFDDTYPTLRAWWKHQHRFAAEHGFVRTGLFRKYPVPDIYSRDRGFRSKAERNAVNGPVQGTGADMIKLAMWLVHKEVKRRGWLDKVLLIACMHDELVFELDLDIAAEAIAFIVPLMCRNPFLIGKKWPVPFTSDVEIGFHWMVPWDLNTMRAERKWDEIRFIGDTKYKKAKDLPAGYDWDELPTWPASLAPYFPEAQGKEPSPPPPKSNPPSEEGSPSEDAQTALEDASPSEDALEDVQIAPPPPSRAAGTPHVHRINGPLTLDLALRLAYVIQHCRDNGTKPLVLHDQDGNELMGWAEEPVLVSAQEFHIVAQEHRV